MRRSKGFTLVELMVVIAVMTIVVMMAVPSFNSMMLNQNLNKSINSLVQEIKFARTAAILNKREITLKLASSDINTDSTFNWVPDGKAELKNASNNQVKFNGNGILISTFTEIELCKQTGPAASKKITLTKFGQVAKIEEGSCP